MISSPLILIAPLVCACSLSAAVMISEIEPNPLGVDPGSQSVELSGGVAGASFDLWFLSLENDGYNGVVDELINITGTYDVSGIAVFSIDDIENPSNTLILTDDFTGSLGDDLDIGNDGNLDLSSLGVVLDAVSISDSNADDATLYGASLGGTNILNNPEAEPFLIFFDEGADEWFQVAADSGAAVPRIFNASGEEFDLTDFTADPTMSTFGAVNPSTVPEPEVAFLSCIGFLLILRRRLSRR